MNPTHLKDYLNTLSLAEISQFLENPSTSVSIGHLRGRHVHLEGHEGFVTFSEISGRIEECYQKALGPTIEKVMDYNRSVGKDPLNRRPGEKDPRPTAERWSFSLKFGLRSHTVYREPSEGSDFWKTWISYPILSQEEESFCEQSIGQRNLAHEKLKALYEKSQIRLETRASNSLFGKIQRFWDGCCNYLGNWQREPCAEDTRDLEWIKSVQERNISGASKANNSDDKSSIDWYELAKAAHKGIGILIDERDQREANLQRS